MDKKGVEMTAKLFYIICPFLFLFVIFYFGINIINGLSETETKSKMQGANFLVGDSTKRDSIPETSYPFWREVCLYDTLDGECIERTYFLIHFIGYGKADSNIFLRKDTIKQ